MTTPISRARTYGLTYPLTGDLPFDPLGGVSTRLFFDAIQRGDTIDGDLGTVPNYPNYSLLAPYAGSFPLPVSSYGRVSGNKFLADAGRIVYARQQVARRARRIRAKVSWIINPAFDGGQAVTGSATAGLLISSNANMVQDVGVHVQCARAGNHLFQKRVNGGSFTTLGTLTNAVAGTQNNGTVYDIDTGYDDAGNWWLTVNGHTISGNDSSLEVATSSGNYCAWEVFQNGVNHVDLVRFHEMSAFSV